jgi:hypothetical protein
MSSTEDSLRFGPNTCRPKEVTEVMSGSIFWFCVLGGPEWVNCVPEFVGANWIYEGQRCDVPPSVANDLMFGDHNAFANGPIYTPNPHHGA